MQTVTIAYTLYAHTLNPMAHKPKTKREYEKAVRINITLPPLLHQESEALLKRYKFACLSEYFQARMRRDLGFDLAA